MVPVLGAPGTPGTGRTIPPGQTADWLAANRDTLNDRFRKAARRWPGLSPQAVLDDLARLLPPLEGREPGTGELLHAAFDLVLLHAGRGTRTLPGVDALLTRTLPALRSVLVERPGSLPGALSNAVENLGFRAPAFASALPALGAPDADTLLAAGTLLAWRLGFAPLRDAALATAGCLPPAVALRALDLAGWPEAALPVVLAGLRACAWVPPRRRLTPATLDELARGGDPGPLLARIATPAQGCWTVVSRVGAFAGLDGDFLAPPRCLPGGDTHRIRVRSAEDVFRVEADAFGWTCHPDRPAEGDAVATPARFALPTTPGLRTDGTLVLPEGRVSLAALADAATFSLVPGRLAVTLPGTYRVALAVPLPEPV